MMGMNHQNNGENNIIIKIVHQTFFQHSAKSNTYSNEKRDLEAGIGVQRLHKESLVI